MQPSAKFVSPLPLGRARLLALGKHNANLARAMRRAGHTDEGLEIARAVVDEMGGVVQYDRVARTLLESVLAFPEDPPDHKITTAPSRGSKYVAPGIQKCVWVPAFDWRHHGNLQKGHLYWMPAFDVIARRGITVPGRRRPLP